MLTYSQPKYWCKHCTIYVKDTPFERKQHENTGKHQGNLKRFLQGIQKDHQRSERDKDRAKAEVDRLNRITGSGTSTSSQQTPGPVVPKASKPGSSNLTGADQKRQWAQLAEMGIAVPEHARAEMAQAGDWQTVSIRKIAEEAIDEDNKLNIGVRKRRFEENEDDDERTEPVARKGWGSAMRTYPTAANTDQDLDVLLEAPVFKKRIRGSDAPVNQTEAEASVDTSTSTSEPTIKTEDPLATSTDQLATSVVAKSEQQQEPETHQLPLASDTDTAQVPVFRKRKTKKP